MRTQVATLSREESHGANELQRLRSDGRERDAPGDEPCRVLGGTPARGSPASAEARAEARCPKIQAQAESEDKGKDGSG